MGEVALNQLSACAIAEGVACGAFTAEAVVRACLDRIANRDRRSRHGPFSIQNSR